MGRDPSDPAFTLETAFYDVRSELDIKYAVGTYSGGKDILEWTKVEGPSQVAIILSNCLLWCK